VVPGPLHYPSERKYMAEKLQPMTDEQLQELCKDAPYGSNEKLVWNDLYGFANILKQYSGYHEPLDGVIPHGVYSPSAGISAMELDKPVANAYNWLPYLDELFKEYTSYNMFPIACPFIYATKILEYEPKQQKGKGTLFIPYHSTDVWDFEESWYDIAMSIKHLPQPVSVLMFFEDINKGRAKYFRKKGYDVYTCGNKFNQDFIYRFINILRNFEYAASNDVSSPAFYATYMGKKFILTSETPVRYEDGKTPWPSEKAFPDEIYDTLRKPCKEQEWLSRVILRHDALQSPDEMKAMLGNKTLLMF
jgi:hypothetical protein